MRELDNAFKLSVVILFFAVTVLELSRGLVTEAIGAALIGGFVLSMVKG